MKDYIEMNDGLLLKDIKITLLHAEFVEDLFTRGDGEEASLKISYGVHFNSIDTPLVGGTDFACKIDLDVHLDETDKQLAIYSAELTLSPTDGFALLKDDEIAKQIALLGYPHARNKVCSLLFDIGLPIALPYSPPVFKISS